MELFSTDKKKKGELFCPKCGSTDWKFPNPLKIADGMINIYSLVNILSECKKCGYIGIFPEKEKGVAIKRAGKTKKEKSKEISPKGKIVVVMSIIVSLFVLPSYYMILVVRLIIKRLKR